MKKDNRKNRIFLSVLKKHWALIWLVCAILGVGTFFVFADYTGLTSVKRVVSTVSSPGKLFSSNSMREDITNHRLTTRAYTVTVCNYAQDDSVHANPSKIKYNLVAKIKVLFNEQYYTLPELYAVGTQEARDAYNEYINKISLRTYSVTQIMEDNGTVSDSRQLVGPSFETTFSNRELTENRPSTGQFTVTFAEQDISQTRPDFYIELEATPTTGEALNPLKGRLYAVQSSGGATAWNGSFQETNVSSVNYDFYNYILKGSGKGIVTVTWTTSKFAVNPFFFEIENNDLITYSQAPEGGSLEQNGKYVNKSDGTSEMKIKVDSEKKNRYTFQLYKLDENASYLNPGRYISAVFSAGVE